jgi:hypothetical protein
MSVHVSSWVLRHSEESVPGRRLVLLVLADKAGDDGRNAYPSVATIARESRLSERGVRYALRELEASGRIRALGIHPQLRTTEYEVVMEEQSAGGNPEPPRGQSDAEKVSQIAPEPSKEPSTTRQRKERARAQADEPPSDFPEDLRADAAAVHGVLRSVAEQHGAREVNLRAVCLAMQSRPRKAFVRVAYDLASWAQNPPRPVRDVVGTYRTFLDREPDVAVPLGVAASAGGQVVRMGPRLSEREARLQRQERRMQEARAEGLVP